MALGRDRVFAVGVKLLRAGANQLELVLDDLVSSEEGLNWRKWAYFTSMSLNRPRALRHELTDAEYARIGQAVMARLVALNALDERKE